MSDPSMSEKESAEKMIRDSEAKFRAIGMSAPDALILINDDGLVEYWNPAAERMFGYSASEMQGTEVHNKVMPEVFRNRFEDAFRKFRDSGKGEAVGRVVELSAKRKGGAEFPIEIAINPILINGKYWSSAIVRDITDRKNAEKDRALNSRRLAALLELSQMSSASIHDLAHFAMEEAVNLTGSTIGYVAFANDAETVLTTYSWSKAAMAEYAIQNKPILCPVESTGLWGEAVRQRRPIITNDYAADNSWKRGLPNGHVRILRHMNVPIFDGDRIVIVAGVGNKTTEYDEGDVRQLTLLMEGVWRIVNQRRAEEERKKLQEQLAQASKMEAIGRLAGGVAHDFNNLLTTILGYTEMILNQLNEEDPLRTEVEEIHKAGERAASLTQQLLAFSRKQVIKPRIIDLNETVKDAKKMLERLIGEHIKLVFNLDQDLGRIKVDPHQIDQVLLNLAVNARDAMPDGGTLTIATSNISFEGEHSQLHPEIASGSYAVLSVTDTGVGMDNEIKARLFEPFFSTKENGKGTGLGLAMVYGIAKQNGGTVSVYSEPGMGTVFRICFPHTSDMSVGSVIPLRFSSPTGNETILLVEDDDLVRRLAQRILTHLGYEVLQAYDIEDAIQICRESPSPIHLLLTDVIMPGMSGVELYDQLRTIRVGLKALFMSGYAEDVVVRHGVLPEGTQFIQKPFNMEDLANRARQALDAY
jgi:PAS domain S-box-containing protein